MGTSKHKWTEKEIELFKSLVGQKSLNKIQKENFPYLTFYQLVEVKDKLGIKIRSREKRPKIEISNQEYLISNKYNEHIDKTYNKLTIVGQPFCMYDFPINSTKNKSPGKIIVTVVKCKCGNYDIVPVSSILSNKKKSCGCLKNRRGEDNIHWKGYKEISGSYWGTVLDGAKQRNLEMSISIEKAWEIYENQGRRCALTGIRIYFETYYLLSGNFTASFDRIDSTKGYIEGNCQWIHKDVNMLKNSWDEEEFKKLCCLVANKTNYHGPY